MFLCFTNEKDEMISSESILVLLYNKKISESLTLNTISNVKSKKNIVIWNNGPNKLNLNEDAIQELKNKNFQIYIEETIENLSLSKIYNTFLRKYKSNRYMILDQDSNLREYDIDKIFDVCDYLVIPNIKGVRTHQYISPIGFEKKQKIMAIMSGICFSQILAEHFVSLYENVFDERYYFYGVDSSFFFRLRKQKSLYNRIVLDGVIYHDLSRYDEEEHQSVFRKKERSYDAGISFRNYPSLETLKNFIYALRYSFGSKRYFYFNDIIMCYLKGTHPKNKIYRE